MPEDIAIAGMDNISFSGLARKSVTSAASEIRELSSTAVKFLFEKIRGQHSSVYHVKLMPEIFVRESTQYG